MRRLIPQCATKRERQPRPVWKQIVLRCLPLGIPLVLATGLVVFIVVTGVAEKNWHQTSGDFVDYTARMGLSVQTVTVDGRERTDWQTLMDALGIKIGDPMLALDLEVARERVSVLPWVRNVAIKRMLPETLVMTLVERRPLALWQNEGRLSVVDAEGREIAGAKPAEFTELLLVVGPDASIHAAALLDVMGGEPGLRSRVAAAVRIGERRWNLKLDDGIEVQLPEDGLEEAWFALADMDRTEQLLARDVQAVDLRFPDRLVVRLTPDARSRMDIDDSEGEDT
ncbi:MAG: FtsQ-type POTRA domain-containing protein [Rhodospirillales bacterium]|nr:FtsQ-type POTRA domain-containing protein [Rhodospirillales bacterium]